MSLVSISESEQKAIVSHVQSKIMGEFMAQSIKDIIAIERDLKTLSTLYRSEDKSYFAYCAGFMLVMNESFNLNDGKTLSSLQIDLIIHGLPKQFPHFRINDVFQVCKKFMMGEYKIEHRLDPPIFFAGCKKYDIERGIIQAECLEVKHHNSTKRDLVEAIETTDAEGNKINVVKIINPPEEKKKYIPEREKMRLAKLRYIKENNNRAE